MRVRSRLRADLLGPVPERPESGDWQTFGCLHQPPISGGRESLDFGTPHVALTVPRDCERALHARRPRGPAPRPGRRRGARRVHRQEESLDARRLWVSGGRGGAGCAHRPKDGPVPENPLESARAGPGSPLTQRCRQQGYGLLDTASSPKSGFRTAAAGTFSNGGAI